MSRVAGSLALLAVVVGAAFVSHEWAFVFVRGGSMAPALYPGDVCVVDRDATPRPDGIALIEREDSGPVLHRLVRRENSAWVTRGDANTHPDLEPAQADEVRGTVVVTFPLGAVVSGWFGQRGGGTLHNQSHSTK